MENYRIIDLHIDEFENRISKIIDSKIHDALSHQKEGEELVSRQQVRERLGIASSTLSDYTQKGILQSYKIGHRVYYKWSEVVNSALKVQTKD